MPGGGEGSRGGQIVGHTRSGAPIYASQLNKTGRAQHGATAASPGGPIVVTHDRHGTDVRAPSAAGAAHDREMASRRQQVGSDPRHTAYMGPKEPKPRLYARTNNLMAAARNHPVGPSPEVAAVMAQQAANRARPRGNLDRPAVLNKPGYRPR